jgi:heme-degrading monooxygenase HmoA|tara:strand:- start:195 stop:497 length:303 start_codon:yes stop_codon:yes gene_type:complete
MFLAMNKFKIVKGREADFEKIWKERDTHLKGVDGFQEFNLLKGNSVDSHTLFASHSIWKSREHFINWTKSEAFKLAHKNAGKHRDIYIGPPELETFEAVV